MKFGIATMPSNSADEYAQMAKLAEIYGFDDVWVPDESPSHPYRDVIVTLTVIALKTKKVKIGTCVCNPYTRNPVLLAVALASVNEISNGRVILGIGAGGSMTLSPLDIKMWKKPLTAVRDAVEVSRRLFTGETVDFDGEFVKARGIRLFSKPRRVPIYLAARGPKMLSLTGEIADGVFVDTTVDHLGYALRYIAEGARKAGRNLGEIDVGNNVPISISSDEKEARELVKPYVTFRVAYSPTHALELSGIKRTEQDAVREVFRSRGMERAKDFVTDRMVDAFAITGSPESCMNKCLSRMKAGITHLIFTEPFGPDPKVALRIIGEEIIPRIHQ
jgi:5,10-methylenetetrahydromethanopterin reductase